MHVCGCACELVQKEKSKGIFSPVAIFYIYSKADDLARAQRARVDPARGDCVARERLEIDRVGERAEARRVQVLLRRDPVRRQRDVDGRAAAAGDVHRRGPDRGRVRNVRHGLEVKDRDDDGSLVHGERGRVAAGKGDRGDRLGQARELDIVKGDHVDQGEKLDSIGAVRRVSKAELAHVVGAEANNRPRDPHHAGEVGTGLEGDDRRGVGREGQVRRGGEAGTRGPRDVRSRVAAQAPVRALSKAVRPVVLEQDAGVIKPGGDLRHAERVRPKRNEISRIDRETGRKAVTDRLRRGKDGAQLTEAPRKRCRAPAEDLAIDAQNARVSAIQFFKKKIKLN